MSEFDPFDDMLSSALLARPEHEPRIGVAGEAIARAKAQQHRLLQLARISWWTRVSSIAAGVLIALTIGVGYWLWPASTSAETADTTTTTLTSTSSIDMTTIGIAAFVVTLIVLVLLTVMTPDRQTLRLTPT
jgi:hypothetical protein